MVGIKIPVLIVLEARKFVDMFKSFYVLLHKEMRIIQHLLISGVFFVFLKEKLYIYDLELITILHQSYHKINFQI